MDLLTRLREVGWAVNYYNDWGREATENELVRILLDAGILYRQRSPMYIRPCDRLTARALGAWVARKTRTIFVSSFAFLFRCESNRVVVFILAHYQIVSLDIPGYLALRKLRHWDGAGSLRHLARPTDAGEQPPWERLNR